MEIMVNGVDHLFGGSTSMFKVAVQEIQTPALYLIYIYTHTQIYTYTCLIQI